MRLTWSSSRPTSRSSSRRTRGITVKLDVIPSENVRTVLQTQLRSGEGPDVFGYDTGPGFAGALAEAGLLYDLTDAYEENDWPIYDFAKERVTFDGKIFGIPSEIETVGLFYNTDLFAELGIERRRTSTTCSALRRSSDAGLIPMAVSDKEGWQGGHLLSMALSSDIGCRRMEALITGEQSWDSPEVVDSLEVWQDFQRRRLLDVTHRGHLRQRQRAVLLGQGRDEPDRQLAGPGHRAQRDFEVGFIPFPARTARGSSAAGWARARSSLPAHRERRGAIKFLDYGMTQEHGAWVVENLQAIPAFPVDTERHRGQPAVQADPRRLRQDRRGHRRLRLQHRRPDHDAFNKAMWNGMQAVLTGQTTPEEVAEQLQRDVREAGQRDGAPLAEPQHARRR